MARHVKQPYVGVSNVARKVKNGFVGVNGVARCFYTLYTWKKYNVNTSTTTKTGTGGSVFLQGYKNGHTLAVFNNTSSYLEYTYGSETGAINPRGESAFTMDYTMQMRVNSSSCGVSSITTNNNYYTRTTFDYYPISLNGHTTYSTWL